MVIYEDIDPMFSALEAELEYNNYLAQKVFFDELAVLSIKFSESTYILEADIKQTVMTYIRKVVANIQNVWNKFKVKITETVWNTIKEKYAKELEMNRPFEITEVNDNDVFVDWNIVENMFTNVNGQAILQIDLNSDEDDIDEIKIFQAMVPMLSNIKIDKLSTGGVMKWIMDNTKMFPKAKVGDTITLNGDNPSYASVNRYRDKLDNINGKEMKYIENSLKNFNEMEKKIEAALRAENVRVQAPEDNGTSVNASAISASSMYDTLLNETTTYITELKGQDAQDPEGLEANGGKKANNNIYKKTSELCKIYTTTLSVLMNVLSKANNKSISIVLKYVRNAAKYRNKNQDQGKTTETPVENPNNGTQINT